MRAEGGGAPKEEAPKEEKPSEPAPKKDDTPVPPPPKKEDKPAAPKEEKKPAAKEAKSEADAKTAPSAKGTRNESKVKMNRMRLRIAERLKQSQNTAASLTTFNEVDMSSIMDFRKLYKDEVLKFTGIKLGFMSAFAKACVMAMKDVPTVNASIEGPGSGDTIVYREYVDLSVAVATPKGLVTPIVRNCESMEMVEIEQAIANLGKKVSQQKCARLRMLTSTGSRWQTATRRHGRWHIYYQQRRGLRFNDGNANHQSSSNSCAWLTRHQRASCGRQWQD